jgi:hypothetical protein
MQGDGAHEKVTENKKQNHIVEIITDRQQNKQIQINVRP